MNKMTLTLSMRFSRSQLDGKCPPAQVALAWLMSRPGVASPIVGVTNSAHLFDALGAVNLQLSQLEIAELEAGYLPHAVAGHQ